MIEEKIEEFNKLTIEGIEILRRDGDIQEIVEKREEIIEFLKKHEDRKFEIEKKIKEIGLLEKDKLLKREILNKKLEIKNELEILKKRRLMRNSYSNINKANYFNRTI